MKRIAGVLLLAAIQVLSLAGSSRAEFEGNPGKIASSSSRQLWVISPDGSDRVQLTDKAGPNRNPSWDADGRFLVFNCKRKTSWEICVLKLSTGDVERITDNAVREGPPSWAPDGRRIVFELYQEDASQDSSEIWVMDRDGSGRTAITEPSLYAWDPEWSPDGDRILFTAAPVETSPVTGLPIGYGNNDIYTTQPDGSDLLNVTQSDEQENTGGWSPDGKRIAYSAYTDGWQIFTISAAGGERTQVTRGMHAINPDWSPNGRKLCFSGFSEVGPDGGLSGYNQIMSIGIDGSGFRVVTDKNNRGFFSCSWQPL